MRWLRFVGTFALAFLLVTSVHAQPWSSILTASRATDWTIAGLPSTITYGSGGSACDGAHANCIESFTNRWTPPARVLASSVTCTNVAGDVTAINSAIAAALPGSYVSVTGTCNTNGTNIALRTNGVTLRGTGPQSATLTGSSAFNIQFGVCCGIGTGALSATSYAAGTTSVTLTGGNANPAVGQVASFEQCDTGWSGASCATGSNSDPGTIWVCGVDYSACSNNNAPSGNHMHQQQNVLVTAVSGTCSSSCTVTFSPGLIMPNWSSTQTAALNWQNQANWSQGVGIEGVTVIFPDNTASRYDVEATYGSWVKGNRIIGAPLNVNVSWGGPILNCLFMNNYMFSNGPTNFSGPSNEPFVRAQDTASLVLNNIITSGIAIWGNGLEVGEVLAYNFARDSQSAYYLNTILNHIPADGYILKEGNQIPQDHGDSTHGTNNVDTSFREYLQGWDAPYYTLNPWSVENDNYNRFYNYIGNVLGGTLSTAYSGTSSSVGNVFVMPTSDNLSRDGMLRWGNVDVITGAARWCGRTDPAYASAPCSSTSEMPDSTTLAAGTYPNATAFQNTTPANHNLPCSFFMTSSSTPCTIKTAGGSGLSWWKVCKTWATFPTSCASTQTQPFPPIGPDQSGGPYVNGYAYDIPASIAYTNLPIDTSLQRSYTITGSSWSNSTSTCATQTGTGAAPCEILTVTMSSAVNNGSVMHIMGGFQLSGVNAACSPSGPPANNEILMTGSTYVNATTITVVYSLASDPGLACTGNMKFPNIRQFDELVYQIDSGPTGSGAAGPKTTKGSVTRK